MKMIFYILVVALACTTATASEKMTVPPIHLDCSEIPDLKPWGDEGVRIMKEWYPKIANMLYSDSYKPPKNIRLKINNPGKGVAGAAGTKIGISATWIKKEPDSYGVLIHELVHVVQRYRGGGVGWLTEGIADYIRWGLYEGKPLDWFPVPRDSKKDYHQSYRVSAGFFYWLDTDRSPGIVKKVNAAARGKRYSGKIFKQETGATLDELWAEYVKVRREK